MLSRNQLHAVTGPIQSTAGAVPVKNEKGQFSMQKVKVNRYISGKRPGYAPRSSSEEESEDEEFIVPTKLKTEEGQSENEEEPQIDLSEAEKSDPRLRRLQSVQARHRRVEAPEIIGDASDSEEEERPGRHYESDSESGDEPLEEDEIERRREYLRQRAAEKKEEEELLTKEEEAEEDSEIEQSESEYEEEYTDSEEEVRPRLKPVFVRKKERVTIKDKEALEEKDNEEVLKQQAEAKRRETLKLLEEELRKEKSGKDVEETESSLAQPSDVVTDDEDAEAEYEAWKIRELKRIKRDRDEKEAMMKEKAELERLHNMTEEERRAELKLRPKIVLNKSTKGKYKFLQKYYHRGVFYLDKEEDVLKRDYSSPTLEDHFDKSILPKVMQVKNFGRSGRTKYTHLVDQDTTNFESPWSTQNPQTLKFQQQNAAGVKPIFEKPSWASTKKRKTDSS